MVFSSKELHVLYVLLNVRPVKYRVVMLYARYVTLDISWVLIFHVRLIVMLHVLPAKEINPLYALLVWLGTNT